MGSVARRPDGQYRARYRDPVGKERSKHFRTKREAERWLASVESTKVAGTYVDPADRTTVAEYARHCQSVWTHHREATAESFGTFIRLRLDPTPLGAMRLTEVRTSDVQAWASAIGLSPATVRVQLAWLTAVFKVAVRDRRVASSPVVKIKVEPVEPKRIMPLTIEQVRAIAAEVPEQNYAMVVAQAGLGLRISELLALRVDDVNFLGREVSIVHQVTRAPGRGVRERGRPKTKRSVRTIPLPDSVGLALAEHIRRWPPLPDGSIFSDGRGLLYTRATYGTRIFKAAVLRLAAAGVVPAVTSSHDLRHHYASVLLDQGERVFTVAARLGDTPAMVEHVYGHVMPCSEDRTRRAIDAAWAVPVAQSADSTRTGG